MGVDRARHEGFVAVLGEGRGAEVQRDADSGLVVGVHHAVDEARGLPVRDQVGGVQHDGLEQGRVTVLFLLHATGVVVAQEVVREAAQRIAVAPEIAVLEGAETQVGRGKPHQHGRLAEAAAVDLLVAGDDAEATRHRNAERSEPPARLELVQAFIQARAPVRLACERRPAESLHVKFHRTQRGVDAAQRQHPAVAEQRVEAAELVTGIVQRQRSTPGW